MRVLLDECVPRRLREELPGHEARTVVEMGWAGMRNGLLLRRAASELDAFVTVDQGIEYQQRLTGMSIAVIIMVSHRNDVDALRPLMPRVLAGLASTPTGEICRVRG